MVSQYVEALKANIAENNAAFAKASRRERRIMVAKDTIASLDAKMIKAKWGEYGSFNIGTNGKKVDNLPRQKAFFEGANFEDSMPVCNACAIGSLFMAKFSHRNHCNFRVVRSDEEDLQFPGGRDMVDLLSDCFTPYHIRMIEVCFERFYTPMGYFADNENAISAVARNMYPDTWRPEDGYVYADARLRAILGNIIENGRFVVPGFEDELFGEEK